MLVNLNLLVVFLLYHFVCIFFEPIRIRRLEPDTGHGLLATFDAEYLLAAHGAEPRPDVLGEGGAGKRAGETNRGILTNVLGDTGGVSGGL